MPAATPQLAQFLAPQRPGEQVPDSQIITQGPFSAELAQPAFRPPPVRETGFGGKGHALLSFANNFLAGASEGRLRQFQQSEQTKKEHERNFDATVQHIMNSPEYTRDFKEQVFQNALKIKASAGLAALGGGKGSGKNDHPLVGMAKHLFSGVVGPSENVKHADIGPEHVSDLISQMHDSGNKFNRADVMAGVLGQMGPALEKLQAAAAATSPTPSTPRPPMIERDAEDRYAAETGAPPDWIKQANTRGEFFGPAAEAPANMMKAVRDYQSSGTIPMYSSRNPTELTVPEQSSATRPAVPLYQQELPGNQIINKIVEPLTRQGINPWVQPEIQAAIAHIPKKLSPEETLKMAHEQASLEHFKAQTEHFARQNELVKRPVPWIWNDAEGNIQNGSVRFSPTGDMQDVDGKPIPVDDPRKTAGRAINPYDTMTLRNAGWLEREEAKKKEDAQYILTHPDEFEKKQIDGAKDYLNRNHPVRPPGTGRQLTPGQIQTQKVKALVGQLRMKHGDKLEPAIEEARTILAADPGAFADVEKALKSAIPKSKTKPPSALDEYLNKRRAAAGGGTASPAAAPPTVAAPASSTATPPVTPTPATAPAAPTNPRTGKPYQVGDPVNYKGQQLKYVGMNPDGSAIIE